MVKNNEYVVYDSMNTQVWYEGDKSTGKKTAKQVFRKHYRKFSDNHKARAYAITLGKTLNKPVWDKYFGKKLVTTTKQKVKNKLSSPNTYQNQLNNMLKNW